MLSKARSFNWINELLIPLAYLVLVICLDRLTGQTTMTPLFGIIGLMVLAFCLPPRSMIFWTVIYSLIVSSIFLSPERLRFLNTNAVNYTEITPYVRSCTFTIAAILSLLLSHVLNRLKSSQGDLQKILDNLPVPILISDDDGRIRFVNHSACEILAMPSVEVQGYSFFDLLAPKEFQGATIANYLGRFNSPSIKDPLLLEYRGIKYKGHTQTLESRKKKLLMIALSEISLSPAAQCP